MRQFHKMVKHPKTIRWQIADELFECVWPFCGIGALRVKKKRKYFTSKDKCPNFTNFFRTPNINNSNVSNEKQKELKMKLWRLHKEISKAFLPVSADLSNDFKLIIFETEQRKISPFVRLFWEEQEKYL